MLCYSYKKLTSVSLINNNTYKCIVYTCLKVRFFKINNNYFFKDYNIKYSNQAR